MEITTTRKAIGRIASLGDLYDGTEDKFIGHSIFNEEIPSTAITINKVESKSTFYSASNSFGAKCKDMNIESETQLSILANYIQPSGSWKYLRDERRCSKQIILSMRQQIKTIDEHLDLLNETFENNSFNTLKCDQATHVLIGISWGANTIISVKYDNIKNENNSEVLNNLKFLFDKAETHKNDMTYKFKIFADIFPEFENGSFKEIMQMVKTVPNLIQNSEGGKGVIMEFTFLPLQVIKKHFNTSQISPQIFYSEMDNHFNTLLEFFETLGETKQNIQRVCEKVSNYKFYISKLDFENIELFYNEFVREENYIKTKIAKEIIKIRSGDNATTLLTSIEQFKNSRLNVKNLLDLQQDISSKIKLIQIVKQFNGIYIDRNSPIDNILNYPHNDIYILYFSSTLRAKFKEDWAKNYNLFLSILQNNSYNKHEKENFHKNYIIDLEINGKHNEKGKIAISHYKNGICVDSDVLLKYECCTIKSFVVCKRIKPLDKSGWPNSSTPLSLPCPNSECKYEDQPWSCFNCFGIIEYGLDNYFYCKCGKGKYNEYEFKCKDNNHGNNFMSFQNKTTFKQTFKRVNGIQETNILILGKTGVGKSTWINGFANFLSYSSLEEAESGKLISPIPSKFTMVDENYEEKTIYTNIDEDSNKNECFVSGQSATQHPQVHTFDIDNMRIRLIDTPGIGDVRGPNQDKINFETTLNTLSMYNKIHGILILLMPNDSRLDVMFKFCITELLVNLQKDASKNIAFIFTNTSGTLYKPGETLPTLRTLLKNLKGAEQILLNHSTLYCMDNAAYRYLAAVKNGIKFNESEKAVFSTSWIKSKEETERLIQYICTLKPHRTTKTVSLNEARSMICQLTKPIAEISRVIRQNIEMHKKKVEEIENLTLETEELKKCLTFEQWTLETKKIKRPRTVCANKLCVDYIKQDGSKVTSVNYKTICHDNCSLKVSHDTYGPYKLMLCSAMKNTYCKGCKHSYREHMHITYDTKPILINVVDKNKQIKIDGLNTDKEKKEATIQFYREIIEDNEKEQIIIKNVCAKFGYFLKMNAITPYNDALIEYLDHLIKEEKNKVLNGDNNSILDGLYNTKAAYLVEFEILEKQMGKNAISIDASEIPQLVNSLYNLPIYGQNLRDVIKTAQEARKSFRLISEKHFTGTRERNTFLDKIFSFAQNLKSAGP